MKQRHRSIIDVHIVFRRDDGRILLGRRANTGYGDAMLHLPSGHLEDGETVTAAALREAFEETGAVVDPADMRFAHVMHRAPETGPDRVGFFFLAERWVGEPRNAEPDRCSELVWADPGDLPPDVIAYPAAGIRAALAGQPYSLFGWPDRPCDDQTLALGLRKGTVTVAEHHPSWAQVAARHAATIRAALAALAEAVEHVGSTAVPDLAAKPIVDLAVRLAPDASPSAVIDVLSAAGFLFRGDKGPAGACCSSPNPNPGCVRSTCTSSPTGDPQWDQYLAVRDRLRTRPQLATTYGELKTRLAAQHSSDRAAYTAAKDAFLRELLADLPATATAPPQVQRVRALLITPAGRLLAIRRTKPGQPPHWVLPGGGIEPGDGSLEDAAHREIREEAGGEATLHRLVHIATVAGQSHGIFLGRIQTWDPAARTGPELGDPANGGYELEELPLDPGLLGDGQIPLGLRGHPHLGHRARPPRTACIYWGTLMAGDVWQQFTDTLAADIAAMAALDTRIFSRGSRYVQIQACSPITALKTVSNEFLPDSQRLTRSEEAALHELGWQEPAPPGQTNWHRDLGWPIDHADAREAAQQLTATIRAILNAERPDQLKIESFRA